MIILPSNSSGEYEVANSLRFDDGSSDYLHRTPSGSGNRKTFTISLWFKRSDITRRQALFNNTDGSGQNGVYYDLQADDTLLISDYGSGSFNWNLETTQVFRDVSAWYHLVISVDTTQSTASNRVKIYINGTQITNFDASNYPSQDSDTLWNRAERFEIGSYNGTGNYFSGYMAEVVLIDGTQLDATSFGEFDEDTGIWKPIDVSSLTFGTNGFYLDFENSSSLGADVSGNGNNFTVNNLTSIDQTTDTCTNNYCTLNPLGRTNGTFSNGNLEIDQNGSTGHTIISTFGVDSGKWYWECKLLNWNSSNSRPMIGVNTGRNSVTGTNEILGYSNDPDGIGYNIFGNNVYQNGSIIRTSAQMGGSVANNDIYMVALDKDNNKFYFGRNGTWLNSGDPESGATGTGAIGTISSTKTYFPATASNDASSNSIHNNDWQFNFGNPVHSISSGNSDGNGHGNFEYAVPSGYYALNTKNLAEYG